MGNIFRKKYKKINIKTLEDISDFSDDEDDKKVKVKSGVNKVKNISQRPSYICKRCSREFFHTANLDQHFWCNNKSPV